MRIELLPPLIGMIIRLYGKPSLPRGRVGSKTGSEKEISADINPFGLLGYFICPSTNPKSAHVSPASQSLPIQTRSTNSHLTLPVTLMVIFLDQDDPCLPCFLNKPIANVLFGVFSGGNVNSRSTRFCEQCDERGHEHGVRAIEMQQI